MKLTYQATVKDGRLVPLPFFAAKAQVGLARFKPGAVLSVTVESEVKRRTLSQNARMWKILETFQELGWEKDEAKTWCCSQFLPPVVREFPDGTRVENVAGTRHLTTAQMGEFMDRIERFLNEKGLWYPSEG